MLGDKVKIHARLVGELDDLDMVLVEIDVGAGRVVVLLHVIEQSEFHRAESYLEKRLLFLNFMKQGDPDSFTFERSDARDRRSGKK